MYVMYDIQYDIRIQIYILMLSSITNNNNNGKFLIPEIERDSSSCSMTAFIRNVFTQWN